MQLPLSDGTVATVSEEKLSTVVSARFTPTEAEELRSLAEGRPLSQFLRTLALEHLHARVETTSVPPAWFTPGAAGTANTTSNRPALIATGGGDVSGWLVQPTAPQSFVGR